MNISEALLSITAYPIPMRTICTIARKRDLSVTDEANAMVLASREYRLATADLYVWLSLAPNVGQGGQSYSFSDKEAFKRLARAIYTELGDEEGLASCGSSYGYKGSRL